MNAGISSKPVGPGRRLVIRHYAPPYDEQQAEDLQVARELRIAAGAVSGEQS